jgi:hypothetical protein
MFVKSSFAAGRQVYPESKQSWYTDQADETDQNHFFCF